MAVFLRTQKDQWLNWGNVEAVPWVPCAVGPLRFRCIKPLNISGSSAGKERVVLSSERNFPATESKIPGVQTIIGFKQILR
jgi:hypothetical protein